MSDISTIIIPNGNEYNVKDGSAVTNITRSGDTFTATRRNGTSFTFTQGHQDISGKLDTSLKGANNGLAELDANGKVPTSQLPSYVPSTATPENVSTTGAVGTSTAYARGDHVHAIALATGDSNGQVKIAGSNVSVKGLQDGAYVNAPRYVNLGSISTLPGTWDVTGITTDMVCSQAILSNPAAQTGDWTVNTNTAGQITLSGTISGTTTVTLVMVPSISVTGVKK